MNVAVRSRPITAGIPYLTAGQILDAVEGWASGCYWVMRETVAGVDGRIDALLVPRSFEASMLKRPGGWTGKLGLVGLEVKASRADFQRGLREGQFDRYLDAPSLAGIFIATGRDVKTTEIPAGFGHIVVARRQGMFGQVFAVCKRNPKWRLATMDDDTAWRIIFYAVRKCIESRHESQRHYHDKLRQIGERFARALDAVDAKL